MEEQLVETYKILIIGDVGVGKTNLLSCYLKEEQPRVHASTIGVQFKPKERILGEKHRMTLHFWDTAGMERYRSITLAHYRKAMGALIVYDITKHSSFANCTLWHEDLKMHAGEKVVIALAGNKFDVVRAYPQERRVTTEQAMVFAGERGFIFAETSAFTGENVDALFESLVQRVRQSQVEMMTEVREKGVELGQGGQPSGNCC